MEMPLCCCPLFWTILSEKTSLFPRYGFMVYSACPPAAEWGLAFEQPERRGGWMTETVKLFVGVIIFWDYDSTWS
jgi:hypothetical protein